MRDAIENGGGGVTVTSLIEPVWKLLDSVLAAAQNRLELFCVEAQEEKIRLFEILMLASVVMVLGTLAVGIGTFAIVALLWKAGATTAIGGVVAAYGVGAAIAWRALRARLKIPSFAATAEELRKDRACVPH